MPAAGRIRQIRFRRQDPPSTGTVDRNRRPGVPCPSRIRFLSQNNKNGPTSSHFGTGRRQPESGKTPGRRKTGQSLDISGDFRRPKGLARPLRKNHFQERMASSLQSLPILAGANVLFCLMMAGRRALKPGDQHSPLLPPWSSRQGGFVSTPHFSRKSRTVRGPIG